MTMVLKVPCQRLGPKAFIICLTYFSLVSHTKYIGKTIKTRRGSPVDDRPSTDKLHHFVRKKKKNDT